MVGLCVSVKTKVCNYGMVELMFWWLGATMLLFILGHRESERKRPVWMCVEESEEKEKYEDNEQVNEWMRKKKKKEMWKTCIQVKK